jgi:hypothetical protein
VHPQEERVAIETSFPPADESLCSDGSARTATFPFSGRFRIVRDAEGPNGG